MAEYTTFEKPIQTVEGWKPFLSKWSQEWLITYTRFSPTVRKNCWLGYPPASEKNVEKLEKRLGYRLPPSFRSFLLTTNGWRRTSSFIQKIRSCSKIEFLKFEDEDFVSVYDDCEEFSEQYGGLSEEEYYSYTPEASAAFDKDHLKASIIVANPVPGDSAMYLLNPMAVTEDGEWEAWFSAHWVPGFVRYPSFFHLMVREYQSFCHLELKQDTKDINGPYTGVYAPEQPRHESVRIGPGQGRR
ncbi:MAG: SMI1/KNR4 family protein [Planctomycetota bacterium]|jgi:hypothetical protein